MQGIYKKISQSSLFILAFYFFLSRPPEQNQISWIRRRDWHILTSGAQLYTNDERFAILHLPGSTTWTLQIKFVQRRDHGLYECQVREYFMFSLRSFLFVVVVFIPHIPVSPCKFSYIHTYFP